MENIEATLSAIKMALYGILVAVLAVLLLVLYEHNGRNGFASKTSGWCGTESTSTPLSTKQQHGKDLFIANCASCHNKNMKDDLTGPALGDVTEHWGKYLRKDLYAYIRNSQAMVKAKHPRAVELWKQWQPTVMNSFSALTDEDIEAILAYIDVQKN